MNSPQKRVRRPSASLVISVLALCVAVGTGSAFAVATIGSKDIKPNAVKSKHIKNNKVKSIDLKNDSIGADDLNVDGITFGEAESSDTDADNIKSVVFDCPEGTVAIGAGAFTSVAFSDLAEFGADVNREVALTDNNRAGSTLPRQWRVTASETDALDANADWSLSGRAVCYG